MEVIVGKVTDGNPRRVAEVFREIADAVDYCSSQKSYRGRNLAPTELHVGNNTTGGGNMTSPFDLEDNFEYHFSYLLEGQHSSRFLSREQMKQLVSEQQSQDRERADALD